MKIELFEYCSNLRSILDKCKINYPNLFGTFPNAYCADASLWLCDFLISNGYDESLFQFRSKDPFLDDIEGNHVWLYYSGFNLDITADQFNNDGYSFLPVIVSKNDFHYLNYDENDYKKDYSSHSFSPSCMFEHWNERYDIVYKLMGIRFDSKSVLISF